MGGGKKPSNPPPSPYESAAAAIAQKTYDETNPLRTGLLSQMEGLVSGGFDPAKSVLYAPLFAAARTGPEAQYQVARDSILAGTPRGGGQVAALSNLAQARADEVGQLPAMLSNQVMQDLLSKTYGAAFNAPQQSMAGLSSVAGTYGNRAAMSQAAAAQQTSGLFGGLGMLGGMALTGKPTGRSLGGK
jgi:hypothetical protein